MAGKSVSVITSYDPHYGRFAEYNYTHARNTQTAAHEPHLERDTNRAGVSSHYLNVWYCIVTAEDNINYWVVSTAVMR